MTRQRVPFGPGDPIPAVGDIVRAGCPACEWQSYDKRVGDEENGAWLAYRQPLAEFRRHWREWHTPSGVRLVERRSEPQ